MVHQAYNARNVFTLVLVFALVVWLLYSLGTFFHRTSKFHAEIETIRQQNVAMQTEIERKERYIEYLRTPQRVDKEAKTQLGRRQPGEQVLVFIDERPDTPNQISATSGQRSLLDDLSIPQKWEYVLFGQMPQ